MEFDKYCINIYFLNVFVFNQSSRIVPSVSALKVVVYLGCTLSILFLLATIIIYLTHK